MSCAVDNNAFEVIITPSRKRKRDFGRGEQQSTATPSSPQNRPSSFTNAAFSSTPKKEIKSLIQKFNRFPPSKRPPLSKDSENKFPADPCLEVKSISDLVNQKVEAEPENAFEVIRKPPKKKKKADIKEACFENPGLNLELPDTQFNPFEVKRESPLKLVKAEEPQCFVNPALNIRTQEPSATRNPFEIQRVNQITENTTQGIENPGLDIASGPLRLGIPFKPTVACRIDFNNLTPSKMLADKLVFSPINPKALRVLSDISEEETTMDIGGELDRYQLELENSINEAKQRKTNICGEKLEDIIENSQEEEEGQIISQEPRTPESSTLPTVLEKKQGAIRLEDVDTPPVQKVPEQEMTNTLNTAVHEINKTYVKDPIHNDIFTDDESIDYEVDDDNAIDFKAPAPFVRAYRKADPVPTPSGILCSRESLKSEEGETSTVPIENKLKMKNIIRNSIRKLMHPNKTSNEEKIEKKNLPSSEHQSTGHHIMETIRHSLRRRPQKQSSDALETVHIDREISIIDTSERKMKFKSTDSQTDYVKIEELTVERKSSLRSSIRKSTRDVKNQIMKSVFHKRNEEYAFA